jgi:hypothetical protein
MIARPGVYADRGKRHDRCGGALVPDWQELADLPFADALEPHAGGLASSADYDGVRFDQLSLAELQVH